MIADIIPYIRARVGLLRKKYTLIRNCIYDYRRYSRWSFAGKKPATREQIRALITMQYHSLEKGLSLSRPRSGFGSVRVRSLMKWIPRYIANYGTDELTSVCVSTMSAYMKFNREKGHVNSELGQFLSTYDNGQTTTTAQASGGVELCSKTKILASLDFNFDDFLTNRHSVRHFAPEPVDMSLISQAVMMAQKTPSVCNRQAWKAHYFRDRERIDDLLRLQQGASGFDREVLGLFVVTSKLEAFFLTG